MVKHTKSTIRYLRQEKNKSSKASSVSSFKKNVKKVRRDPDLDAMVPDELEFEQVISMKHDTGSDNGSDTGKVKR
jgi:hypothetical protein